MSWTAPFEWTAGYVVTAAKLNEQLYYNMRYLKGLDGDITIEANLVTAFNVDGVDVSVHKAGTAKAQHTAGAGDHTHQSAGAEGATLDHGLALTGRSDDDHAIYALRTILTTRGDIVYRNATVWARLAKGTEGHFLKIGADDPEWAVGVGAALEATVPLFQANAASGTASFSERINDNDTGTVVTFDAISEYTQVNFLKVVSIKRHRHYGNAAMTGGEGRWTIQYYNLITHAWTDWVTGIVPHSVAEWTGLSTETEVQTDKVRIIATALDSNPAPDANQTGEFEIIL